MKNQIRIPKAKKVNAVNMQKSDLIKNPKNSFQIPTKLITYEKNRFEENLTKCKLQDEHIYFEDFESDINDQIKKVSAYNEITNIVNNLNEFPTNTYTKTTIVRSVNPFSKNFENKDFKKELPKLIKINSKDSTDDEEEEEQRKLYCKDSTDDEEVEPRNTKLFLDSSSTDSNLEIITQ